MKHDHKKTKKLKVTLFSIVMLLPCLAVGITCLTHVFNKEVAEDTQTATINYKFEIGTTPNDFDELQINTLYKLNTTPHNDINEELQIKYITDNVHTYYNNNNEYVYLEIQADAIYLYTNENTTEFNINNTYIAQWGKNINTYDFWHNYTDGNNDYNLIESITINTITQDHTTNIFYDSCEQVKDSFILNWCNTNNPISQPIISFTNVFSLPNDHIINTVLTYWFSISMIYIVIDIIIECIVYITHFFNKEQ